MSIAILLIPDFALILFGFILNHITGWGRDFWAGLEKLIYYVLFPALLFNSIARTRIDFAAAAPALETAATTVLSGMALAWLARYFFKQDEKVFASGFQTAFRFNSYVGLAIAGRLHGDAGIAAFGIIIGLVVPMCNIASVWALAKHLGIPQEIVEKPATADLVQGQTDEGDLGISYGKADKILHGLLSGLRSEQIVNEGHSKEDVALVKQRLESTHWKRRLPTVAMISNTAIGDYYLRPVDY